MKSITKTEFLEMFALNILDGSRRGNKEWSIICPRKKSKRKKRYVDEYTYTKYLIAKEKQDKQGNKDNKT